MKIKYFIGGYDKNISYLIWCSKTKSAAVIDPAVDPTDIIDFIIYNQLKLEIILITHSHFDHIKYLKEFIFYNNNIHIYVSKKTKHPKLKKENKISHNQTIKLGNEEITCLQTPGHLNDSVSYWIPKNKMIFTGDTMFIGRTGRVVSKESNINELYDSIYNILLKIPLDTIIYSGHNYGKKIFANIKYNIENSSFFRCDSLNEFKIVMKNYEKNKNK